jgi:pimeloyl-ACP methyl ester carboxylesterase
MTSTVPAGAGGGTGLELPDAVSRRTVRGRAGEVSYLERAGSDDTAVVFLHPANTNALVWAHVMRALGDEWPMIALDYRGHGDSAAGGPYLPSDYASDARAVLDDAGVGRVHLVCGSIGGAVAVELAANEPGRVASISAYGAGIRIGWSAETVQDIAIALRARGVREWFVEHGGGVLGPDGRPEAGAELAELAAYRRGVDTVIDVIRGTFELADSRRAAEAVALAPPPSQVRVGALDPTCPPPTAHEMAVYLRCDVTVLPGVGHLPMLEDPSGTAQSLRSFLRHLPMPNR